MVAPPSIHASGTHYRWVSDLSTNLAPAPPWAAPTPGMRAKKEPKTPTARSKRVNGGRVKALREGERNAGLYERACLMRCMGLSNKEILATLQVSNLELCQPPLEQAEVKQTACSACRHVAGFQPQTFKALALGPHALAVYIALWAYANPGNTCFPGQETIQARSGVGRTKISKVTYRLEEAKLIKVNRELNYNRYTLL